MRPLVKKVPEVIQTFSLSLWSTSPYTLPPFLGKGRSSSSLYLLMTQGSVDDTLTSFSFQSLFQLALISNLVFVFLKLQSLMWFEFLRSNFDFLSFKISNLMGFLDHFFFLDLLSFSFSLVVWCFMAVVFLFLFLFSTIGGDAIVGLSL